MSGWSESDLKAHFDRLKLPFPERKESIVSGEYHFKEDGPSPNKMRNRPTTVDGTAFQSLLESDAYRKLIALEKLGWIRNLKLQPHYELQRPFITKWGKKIRAITYILDFEYQEAPPSEQIVVIDAKGHRTTAYILKSKWFQEKYPHIKFEEWTRAEI